MVPVKSARAARRGSSLTHCSTPLSRRSRPDRGRDLFCSTSSAEAETSALNAKVDALQPERDKLTKMVAYLNRLRAVEKELRGKGDSWLRRRRRRSGGKPLASYPQDGAPSGELASTLAGGLAATYRFLSLRKGDSMKRKLRYPMGVIIKKKTIDVKKAR
jgi:hypothetical protein